MLTHASQPSVSLAPAVQGACAQAPPPEVLLEELDVVLEELLELLLDALVELLLVKPPQTLVLGTHARNCCPLASATGVQVVSPVHAAVAPHVGAQN